MLYIGIDPGISGALAVIETIWDSKRICKTYVYGWDADRYLEEFDGLLKGSVMVVLEKVWGGHARGIKSSFTFGENFGWIQGVLQANKIPYQLVTPQTWKKAFCVTSDKKTSIKEAKRLFPEVSLLRSKDCEKDDDNLAEALLIAEYARRKL